MVAGMSAATGASTGAGLSASTGPQAGLLSAGSLPTQQVRAGLARARELFAERGSLPHNVRLEPAGFTVQELCFAVVLWTHQKRRVKY
jgi:hypothetical protein